MISSDHIITAIITGAAAFSGWQVNQWRHDANQKQTIEAAAVAQRELHALEQKRSSGVIAAQNVARTREAALRRDAAAAQSELDRLRTQSDAALHRARGSHAACLVAADAQAVVQSQCAAELTTLAEAADGHASDARLMLEAWPK